MKEKLLILGAGIMQIPIIKKASEQGYEVLVADYDEKAPGKEFASKFYCISTLDADAIFKIANSENVSGILTTSDAPVRVVANVGNKLGLPVMTEKVSEICTNKYLQREILKSKGIKCPEFRKYCKKDDLSTWNSFPCIVKPVDSSASRGVKKINSKEELGKGAEDAFQYSNTGFIIIESYIEGREFSVETFTRNHKTDIIVITEKKTAGEEEGYFVESMHLEPARISAAERELIEEEVRKTINAIGMNNCPSHIEVKLNGNGAHIIEGACRLGGDYITSDLVPLSTGVDMLDSLIRVSMGKELDCEKKISKISCVQFILPDNYRKCEDFIKSENKSIIRFEIEPYQLKAIKSSMDRLGYIILQTDTTQEMEKILEEISNE